MSDEILYILKKLDDSFTEHTKQDDENFKKIGDELEAQNELWEDIRDDLNTHIQGVVQNRGAIKIIKEILIRDNNRMVALEAPKKAREYIKHFLIDTSKLVGSILAIGTAWKMFGEYITKLF